MNNRKMKTVVIIGGGTAAFTLLKGLCKFPTKNIVIVSTADSGGSTGRLRKELGVMPMGDIRQCLMGLSYTASSLHKLFQYRFDRGSLKGHNVGNIILAAFQKVTGSPEGAIAEVARLLNVRGEVLFVSKQPTMLSARLADGSLIKSEHELDEPVTKKRASIEKLMLSKADANPSALNAIARADAIVLGPGDLYTSTFPNLLVPGIAQAVKNSSGKKIFITNLMTKLGQTDGFKASDFVRQTNAYLGARDGASVIDAAIVNTEKPRADIIARYRKEKAFPVRPDIERIKDDGIEVVARPVISGQAHKKARGDVLTRSLIRHDSEKTASILWDFIREG